jgi:hypothetical protein
MQVKLSRYGTTGTYFAQYPDTKAGISCWHHPCMQKIRMFSALLVFAGIWVLMSFVFVAALCVAASKGTRQQADTSDLASAPESRPTAFAGTVPSLTH